MISEPKTPDEAQETKAEAGYSERPEAKGFGCSRCEYSVQSVQLEGKSWCSFWGLHIKPLACCSEEDGPDLILAPGEKNSKSEDIT